MTVNRAVGVLRVSTDRQEVSPRVQLEAIQRSALQHDAELVEILEDTESGSLYLSREGLQTAIRIIQSGRANLLIVYNVDRLSRKLGLTSQVAEEIGKVGGKLVFTDGTFYDAESPQSVLNFGVREVFSAFERGMIRERTVNALRSIAHSGQQPGRSNQPYGYRVIQNREVEKHDPRRGKCEIVPEEAEVVREIYGRYVSGASLYAIAGWLASSAFPSPRGKGWNRTTISRLIGNPLYKGQATYGKRKRTIDESRIERGLSKIHYRPQPRDCWILIAAPPIVSDDLWERANALRGENRKRLSGSGMRKYLLSGLVRCPRCDASMGGHRGKYYVCTGRCRKGSCRMERTDAMVIHGVLEVIRRPQLMEAAIRAYQKNAARQVTPSELEDQRAKVREVLEDERATIRAQVQSIRNGVDSSVYDEEIARISHQRREAEERLRILEGLADRDDARSQVEQYRAALSRAEQALTSDRLSPAQKHAILSLVIRKILPEDDGSIQISLCNPDSDQEGVTHMLVWTPVISRLRMPRWRSAL